MSQEYAIHISSLTKTYPPQGDTPAFVALDNVSLNVKRG